MAVHHEWNHFSWYLVTRRKSDLCYYRITIKRLLEKVARLSTALTMTIGNRGVCGRNFYDTFRMMFFLSWKFVNRLTDTGAREGKLNFPLPPTPPRASGKTFSILLSREFCWIDKANFFSVSFFHQIFFFKTFRRRKKVFPAIERRVFLFIGAILMAKTFTEHDYLMLCNRRIDEKKMVERVSCYPRRKTIRVELCPLHGVRFGLNVGLLSVGFDPAVACDISRMFSVRNFHFFPTSFRPVPWKKLRKVIWQLHRNMRSWFSPYSHRRGRF